MSLPCGALRRRSPRLLAQGAARRKKLARTGAPPTGDAAGTQPRRKAGTTRGAAHALSTPGEYAAPCAGAPNGQAQAQPSPLSRGAGARPGRRGREGARATGDARPPQRGGDRRRPTQAAGRPQSPQREGRTASPHAQRRGGDAQLTQRGGHAKRSGRAQPEDGRPRRGGAPVWGARCRRRQGTPRRARRHGNCPRGAGAAGATPFAPKREAHERAKGRARVHFLTPAPTHGGGQSDAARGALPRLPRATSRRGWFSLEPPPCGRAEVARRGGGGPG